MRIINLSNHASVRLAAEAPFVMGTNPKTGRELKVADLSEVGSVEAYLDKYQVEVLPANDGTYANPKVSQVEATTIEEVVDGIAVTRNVGGATVVEGLPEPQEDTIFLTSFVTAQAANRSDVVSPATIADPATGFAIGATGYIAFG